MLWTSDYVAPSDRTIYVAIRGTARGADIAFVCWTVEIFGKNSQVWNPDFRLRSGSAQC